MAGGYPCCCAGGTGSTSSPAGSAGSSQPASMDCGRCAGGIAPAQLQLVLAGVMPGTAFLGCQNEELWNATWVLDGIDGACVWQHIIDTDISTRCKPLNIFLFLRFEGGHWILDLDCAATNSVFTGVAVRHAVATIDLGTTKPDCFEALDGLVFSGFTGLLTPLHYDFSAATGTITVI